MNLWAVIEYIAKYATKAASGSRKVGDVLQDAVTEICKYTPEDEEHKVGWRALQKFYSRMLGERDYSLFETVHIGLGLPLMHEIMPVVGLNTAGTRVMKTTEQLAKVDQGGQVTWPSKVDKFDDRLQAARRRFRKQDDVGGGMRRVAEEEVHYVSFYEFWEKHTISRGRVNNAQVTVALQVTPGHSAACAGVGDSGHEGYARTCVIAYWRMVPTLRRYQMIEEAGWDVDVRRWGGQRPGGAAPARGAGAVGA